MSKVAGWILLGVHCGLFLMAFPLLIGFASRTARRAALLSALSGLVGGTIVAGVVVYVRGVRGVPPTQLALFLFGASAATASAIAWLTQRVVGFYRQESPLAASRQALWFLFLGAVRVALLYVVLNGIYIVAVVAFADEIPQVMFLYLGPSQYLYVGAATVIGFAWLIMSTRQGRPSGAMSRAIVQVVPAALAALLFLPLFMAQAQVTWSTPLLDCSPRGIPGYVPDMIDYTRLVMDSLLAGALVGLRSLLGWQVATCAPLATSHLASYLVYGLNFVPVILLALLAYRTIVHARFDAQGS